MSRQQESIVTLTAAQRFALGRLIAAERRPLQEMQRAKALLLTHAGGTLVSIAAALDVSPSNVSSTRRRFREGGLDFAIEGCRVAAFGSA